MAEKSPPAGTSPPSKLINQGVFVSTACGGPIKAPIALESITAVLDAGTGAAGWLDEVAHLLPSTAELWGVDKTDAKFPSTGDSAVHLEVLDLLDPLPDKFGAKFDVVNMRHVIGWVDMMRSEEALTNLLEVLKPGGYIQSFDTRMVLEEDFPTFSPGMQKFVATSGKMFGLYEDDPEVHLHRRIIPELPSRLAKLGYINVTQTVYPLPYGKLQEDPIQRDLGIKQMFTQAKGFQAQGYGAKEDGEERLSVVVEGKKYYVPGNETEWTTFFEESERAFREEGWGLPVRVTVGQKPN